MLRCLPWLSCAAQCLSTESSPAGANGDLGDPATQSHVDQHIEALVETGQAVAIGLEDGTSEEDFGRRTLQIADVAKDHSGLFSFVESCRQSMLVPVTPSGPPEGSPWDSHPHEQLPATAAADASDRCLACNQMQRGQQQLLGLMASLTQPPSPAQPTPLHNPPSVPPAATNVTAQPHLPASSHHSCHPRRPASTPSGLRHLARGGYLQGPRCSHDLLHSHARQDARAVSVAVNTLMTQRTMPGAAGTLSDCATGTSCTAATGTSATLPVSGYPSAAFGYDLGNSTRSTNSTAAATTQAFRAPPATASACTTTTTTTTLAIGPGQPHASSHGCTTQPAPLRETYGRHCSSTLCGMPRGTLSGRASPTLPPSLPARSTTADGILPQPLAQPTTPPFQRRYPMAKFMSTPTGAGEGRKRALSALHPVPAAATATAPGAPAHTCPGARGLASVFAGQQATHGSAAVAGSAPHAWLLAHGSHGGNSGCASTPRGSVIGTGTCPGASDPATWSPARLAAGLGSSLGSVQSSPLHRQRQQQLVLLRAPPPVEVVGSHEQLLEGLVDLAALQPAGRRGAKGAAALVVSGTWHGTTRVAVKLLQRDAAWADGCPARAAALRAAQLCHTNLVQLFAVRLMYDPHTVTRSGGCASVSARSSVGQTGPHPNRNSSSKGVAGPGVAPGVPAAPLDPTQVVQADGAAFTMPRAGKLLRNSRTGDSAADTPKTDSGRARLLRAPAAGPAASPSVPEGGTAVVPEEGPVPPRPGEDVYVGTGWRVALIMEHCDMGDLGSLCCSPASPFTPRHGWPLRAAQRALLATAREVAGAMAAVHAAGAAHGGLQPANVLLATCHSDARGFTAKVADVGAAAALHGAQQPARPHPAMLFQAPEALTAPPPAHRQQQQGTGEVAAGQQPPLPPLLAPAADVYSYGMLLYTMAAGRTPFQGMHLVSALMGVASEGLRPEWPTGQHASCLAQLYDRCTRQRPEERPTFTKILRDLQHCDDLLATAVLYGSAWT